MKKGVKVLLILLGVIIIIAVFAAVFMSRANKNLEALSDIQVEDIDIAAIPDGMYKGSYKSFRLMLRLQ
jgi:flagellar basal body-associated protein FliL